MSTRMAPLHQESALLHSYKVLSALGDNLLTAFAPLEISFFVNLDGILIEEMFIDFRLELPLLEAKAFNMILRIGVPGGNWNRSWAE